jgi:MSHA pilin protein MshA
MLRNEKGFTLIEIIAVLVILGILAAVAVPKYIDMLEQSRVSAAQGAIAEIKARASGFYSNKLLVNGAVPTSAAVLASVQGAMGLGNDFGGSAAASGSDITITIGTVKGTALTSAVVGTWIFPTAP